MTIETLNLSDGTKTVGMEYVLNGSAKASINYNGINNTIRSSMNISSVIDNGTGLPTLSFASGLLNGDYVAECHSGREGVGSRTCYWCFPSGNSFTYSGSQLALATGYNSGTSSGLTVLDNYLVLASVNGDLA